jgi:hypothetical protein
MPVSHDPSLIAFRFRTLSPLWYLGSHTDAMKTAIKCCEYSDLLDPKDVYMLLCLTSYRCKYFGICSKSLVKVGLLIDPDFLPRLDLHLFPQLETLPATFFTENEADRIQTLSVSYLIINWGLGIIRIICWQVKIFANNTPKDPESLLEQYSACLENGKSFKACLLTGK